MEFKIKEIIDSEDKKNPYTDEEIAKKTGVVREVVTQYRRVNKIPDSRQRRRKVILKDALEIITEERNNISDRAFTRDLNARGYKLSRYTAVEIKKEAAKFLIESDDTAVSENNKNEHDKIQLVENVISEDSISEKTNDPFECIIGHEDSLKLQINQAKAAFYIRLMDYIPCF